MTKTFITFGGGEQKYIDAVNRLINQVESLKLFNTLKLITHENLITKSTIFICCCSHLFIKIFL
jgi:hypothetical protein